MSAPTDCIRNLEDAKLLAGLDQLDIGCSLFDRERRLLGCNDKFREHGDYPERLCLPGTPLARLEDLGRQRGQGSNNAGLLIEQRCADLDDGGLIVISADVTDYRNCAQKLTLAQDATQSALEDLATTQTQLGDAERMAALGELTAGVAHEIKNPLNFINNFAHVSLDLMDEAVQALAPAIAKLDLETRVEIDDLLGLVKQNFVKINQHGRRADSIIRTMLMHARQRPDNTQIAPLNTLVEEVFSLAKQDLEMTGSDRLVDLKLSLSPNIGAIECFPEDLVRALFNLVSNGIHAAQQNCKNAKPMVEIITRRAGNKVEIEISDNGIGMAADVLDKALTPFFTTKPPGEGVGLGLSLTHDVISRQHRGTMVMVSEPGIFTRVTVTLRENLPERRRGGRRHDDD